jgi:sigma-E factor negative regulatory protein RseC
MLEQQALVTRVEHDIIYVKSLQTSACGHCAQQHNCGTPLYTMWLPQRELALPSQLPVAVGDTVIVAIDESHLLRASLFVYLLPLLLMMLAAGFASIVNFPPAIAAFSALMAGFFIISRLQWRFIRFFIDPPQLDKIP